MATLEFHDEFDTFKTWDGSAGWDTKRHYDPVSGAGHGSELQWYINEGYSPTDHVNPWTVSNGVLNITAAKAEASIKPYIGNMNYTSGMINSYHDFSQTYGYFEMRAELPAGKGLWPAFWLLRKDGQLSSEIDIFEQLGHQPTVTHASVHSFASGSISSQSDTYTGVDTSAGMHTYALDWTAEHLAFYVDNQKYFEVATPSDMHAPMYMIANLAVGGSWPGSPDASTSFPATMKVDYIRVYDAKPGGETPPSAPSAPEPSQPTSTFDGATWSGTDAADTVNGNPLNNTMSGHGGSDVLKGGGRE